MSVLVILSVCMSAVLACNQDLEGATGTFTSPNHPAAYPNNADCYWSITVPTGRVQLSFTAFTLEGSAPTCAYDKVVVREGSSTGAIIATLCGSQTQQVIESTGNRLYVKFTSDSSLNYAGFTASWTVATGVITTQAAPAGCGGSLSGVTGTFQSPGYPGSYGNNMRCTWTITIPEGIIALNFNTLSLEASSSCSYDYLKIYDGASGALLTTLCGSASQSVEGTSSSLRIEFVSDASVTGAGWSASWTRLTCASRGLTCVASATSCRGQVINGLFCENNGVCCQPPFDQGNCGVLPPNPMLIGGSPRIVGGDEAERHSWPWQTSLRTKSTNFHFCGASLISELWVVTAAHCVEGESAANLKVVTGEHRKNTTSGREVDHFVSKIIMHEAYDGNGAGFPNDLALLKLTAPVAFDNFRSPICLPDPLEDFIESISCFITGWGNTQGTGDTQVLNELSVTPWQQSACISAWGSSYINPGHICVGTGDTGACNGDSGGPLACLKNRNGVNRWILAGATSWGRSGCQTRGYPSVYCRISHYRDWILGKIRAN